MIKKFVVCAALIISLLFGCRNKNNIEEKNDIPAKQSINDTSSRNSPVNSLNLDSYMFRDDVQYVDLRNIEMILEEGHISGFEFIPFYSIIASFNEKETLYQMVSTRDSNDKLISAGQVGSFEPQYEESERILKSLFSKDKYIFFVSQGGSESSYVINLLIQLGYNGNLLYNVGGVMNSEGNPSYSSVETNKYFVYGHGDLEVSIDYDFMNDLTPIINN